MTVVRKRGSVFEIPDFKILVFTRLCMYTALQTQAVIVGWQIYQMRKDPLLLGLIGLAEAIPAIGSAFVSGHFVDVKRPAKIYQWSMFMLFLNSSMLFVAISPFVPLTDDGRIALLFSAIFLSGAARSFATPSVYSLVPQIVGRARIAESAAWHGSIYQVATIVGPTVGGLLYGFLGPQIAFAIPVLLLSFAFSTTYLLSPEAKRLRSNSAHEPFLKSIAAGIQFAFGNKVLLSAMALDMFSVLFGGAVAVLPIFADQILHVGSTGLGFLRAAPSFGSIIVGLAFAVRPMRVISGRTLLLVVAGFGLSTLAFALTTNFWLALFFLAASGAFDGVSMVIRSTIEQLLTPDHMRGRVSSVSSVFITSSNEIGAFESGVAAKIMGLVPSLLFGGAMTLVVVVVTAWLVPSLRHTRIDLETQSNTH